MNDSQKNRKNISIGKNKPFEIHISKIDDHYHFIIEDPTNPIASFSEKIQIPSVSRNRILKKLDEFLTQIGIVRGSVKVVQRSIYNIQNNLEKLGRLIFKYMIPASCKSCLRKISTEYVILSTEDVEIPWELMHDSEEFFCLKYSVGRKIQAKVSIKRVDRPKSDKVRFLFISNPTLDLPKTEEEVSRILCYLKDLDNIDAIHISGKDATVDRLLDVLEEGYFDVIHYAGYATFNVKNPEYSAIRLHDEDITAKYLLNVIDIPPKIVFMNACESASSSDIYYLEYGGKLTGLASAFISAGVDAYIGALWPVADDIAAELAISFYSQLLRGETVGKALRKAKLEIYKKYNDFLTWAAFILYGDPTLTLLEPKKQSSSLKGTFMSYGNLYGYIYECKVVNVDIYNDNGDSRVKYIIKLRNVSDKRMENYVDTFFTLFPVTREEFNLRAESLGRKLETLFLDDLPSFKRFVIKFDKPIKPGETKVLTIKLKAPKLYEVYRDEEFWSPIIDGPTKVEVIRILFPPGKRLISVKLIDANQNECPEGQIYVKEKKGRTLVICVLKNPTIRKSYKLLWKWV